MKISASRSSALVPSVFLIKGPFKSIGNVAACGCISVIHLNPSISRGCAGPKLGWGRFQRQKVMAGREWNLFEQPRFLIAPGGFGPVPASELSNGISRSPDESELTGPATNEGQIMTVSVRAIATGLIAIAAMMAMATPASAWHGHRSYRSYRGGRGSNRYAARNAALQRASATLNSARARLAMAQANAAREVKRARQQAANSPAVVSAKSEYSEANRDSQTARAAAVAHLKETNPEFRDLLAKCQSLRQQIATLAKSGDTSGKMASLESELRGLARKTILIEDQALSADSTLKDADNRKANSHAKTQSAESAALGSTLNDPQVKAAQALLAQAQLQVQQASARYSQTLASANGPSAYGGRSYHRPRLGYRGYRGVSWTSTRHRAHHAGYRRRR